MARAGVSNEHSGQLPRDSTLRGLHIFHEKIHIIFFLLCVFRLDENTMFKMHQLYPKTQVL